MALETGRRLVHASGAVVPGLYLVDLLTWGQVRYLLLVGILAVVLLEDLRLGGNIDWRIFDHLTREYERDSIAGYALYVVSGAVAGLTFGPQVAVPAIFMLTLADPISGVLSTGELRTVKRARVLVAMFVASTALAVPFVPPAVAVLGGLGAMVADGVKPIYRGYVLDDNLTIPLFAGGAMALGVRVLPAIGLP
jgi:dolichol kinase